VVFFHNFTSLSIPIIKAKGVGFPDSILKLPRVLSVRLEIDCISFFSDGFQDSDKFITKRGQVSRLKIAAR